MNPDTERSWTALRARAEAMLDSGLAGQPTEVERLLHDLSVHQIELELQNEELRDAEQRIERDRDRYAWLYHQAPVGYLSLDASGLIHQVNQTFATLVGRASTELEGKALTDLLLDRDRAVFLGRYRAFFRNPEGKHIDIALLGAEGRLLQVRLTGRADVETPWLPEPAASPPRLLVIIHDISAQKKMEDALRESEERYRGYYELGLIGMAITGLDKRWIQVNDLLCEMLGYSREELVTKTWEDLTHPGDLAENERRFNQVLAGETDGYLMDKRFIRQDGGIVHTMISVRCVRDVEGAPLYFVALLQDITERKQAEAVLKDREATLRSITDAAQDAILMMDPQGRISFWNPAAEQIFGYSAGEALGQNLHDLLAPARYHRNHHRAFPEFQRTGRGAALGKTLGLHALRRDGVEIAVAVSLSAIHLEGEWHAVGIVRDETERQAQERELRRLATTDPLTGLANRRHFLAQVERELERFQRYAEPVALLMLDLDHFKQVNDRYGHAAGDTVLQHFAAVAQNALRKIDILGRLGGEEFAALLPDTRIEGARRLAERLRRTVADSPAVSPTGEVRFTVSVGLTLLAPGDRDAGAILTRADRALYRAKDRGRNRVEVEEPP